MDDDDDEECPYCDSSDWTCDHYMLYYQRWEGVLGGHAFEIANDIYSSIDRICVILAWRHRTGSKRSLDLKSIFSEYQTDDFLEALQNEASKGTDPEDVFSEVMESAEAMFLSLFDILGSHHESTETTDAHGSWAGEKFFSPNKERYLTALSREAKKLRKLIQTAEKDDDEDEKP
jgi:hypothetical protein